MRRPPRTGRAQPIIRRVWLGWAPGGTLRVRRRRDHCMARAGPNRSDLCAPEGSALVTRRRLMTAGRGPCQPCDHSSPPPPPPSSPTARPVPFTPAAAGGSPAQGWFDRWSSGHLTAGGRVACPPRPLRLPAGQNGRGGQGGRPRARDRDADTRGRGRPPPRPAPGAHIPPVGRPGLWPRPAACREGQDTALEIVAIDDPPGRGSRGPARVQDPPPSRHNSDPGRPAGVGGAAGQPAEGAREALPRTMRTCSEKRRGEEGRGGGGGSSG
jgi:hypothetical protein